MKKVLAFLTASVMALGSLPFLSVGAESFAPGDVDMDGVLTGHDAALVSRHLIHGDNNLSEEQLKLADYNGDGVVDEEDVKAIVADEEDGLSGNAGEAVTERNFQWSFGICQLQLRTPELFLG